MIGVNRLLTALAAVLLVGACGGSGDGAEAGGAPANQPTTPIASTPTDVPSHAAESGEPTLVNVAGYEYLDPTGAITNACKLFSDEIMDSCSVHGVSRLGEGYIVLWGFNPDLVPPGTMVQGMTTTFEQQGAKAKSLVIAGEDVVRGTLPDGSTTLYAWEHDGVLGMVQSDRPDDAANFVTQYVTALNS
jgi:hypothetical protein